MFLAIFTSLLTFILFMITYIKKNEYVDITTNITKETSTVVL